MKQPASQDNKMRRGDSQQLLTEDDKKELCRKLKDKYVDKFGYAKKIVIDDCLTQFFKAHDSAPSTTALKELDVVMKKRVMGKDVNYNKPPENNIKSKGLAASQPQLAPIRNADKAGPQNRVIGKAKDDKAVDAKIPEVTGKITALPPPKIKRKAKAPEEPTVTEKSMRTNVDEELLDSILKGEAPDPNNPKKKLNKWGLIEMYKSQQYENEIKKGGDKKKEVVADYKKQLDEQMSHIRMIKKMDEIETKAGQLKLRGENFSKKPVDEKALLTEYDSLQKEMEKSHVIQSREMMIHRLQNEYAWVTGVGVGRPAKTEWEKQEQITKYKDILDRQMQDKTNFKAEAIKDKEFYKNMYKQAGEELQNKNREHQFNKKIEHEKYSKLLDEQLLLKKKINSQEMNENEFRLNRDIISKASAALYKS